MPQGGQVDYTTKPINVTLDQPDSPRVARALELLVEELNTTPVCLPGDRRPLAGCTDAVADVIIGNLLEPGTHVTCIGGRPDARTRERSSTCGWGRPRRRSTTRPGGP